MFFSREESTYYLILQQNEKSTKNYTRTACDGSSESTEGLGKLQIRTAIIENIGYDQILCVEIILGRWL